VRLQQIYAITGQLYSGLQGDYRYAQPKPVDVNLSVCELAGTATSEASHDFLRGTIRGDAHLLGTLLPLELESSGQFHGDNVVFDNRPPQQFVLRFSAGLKNSPCWAGSGACMHRSPRTIPPTETPPI
jgi:hypothetical protein